MATHNYPQWKNRVKKRTCLNTDGIFYVSNKNHQGGRPVKSFLEKYHDSITGAISGFDRLIFRGTIRRISSVSGLNSFLQYNKILLKDFGDWANEITSKIRSASEAVALNAKRPIQYINSSSINKEDYARSIAKQDKITDGLICVLTSVDPCMTFDIRKNGEEKTLELVARERKCLWIYHYMVHPVVGFMHARIQTWLPFTIKIWINGREWLSKLLDKNHIGYTRRNNCFVDIEDVVKAQSVFDTQLKTDWPDLLNSIEHTISPAYHQLFKQYPMPYYWSADESEWATDIMFKDSKELSAHYKHFLTYAMTTFNSTDIMRFLGRINETQTSIHKSFKGQVITNIKERPEGVRIKHWVNNNSIKMYNKESSVLRTETTINNTREFKVFRQADDNPEQPYKWQRLRKGVADLHRRAQISQVANSRYLEALSVVKCDCTVEEQLESICQKVIKGKKRYRGINYWAKKDAVLLSTICRAEFTINGIRNRDLAKTLYPKAKQDERKKISARVSRDLRLLRAHGLIKKIAKTHRYVVTEKGRKITSAFLMLNSIKISNLYDKAA